MIEHSPSRTRALYIWEREVIEPASMQWRMSLAAAQRFTDSVWRSQGWSLRHSAPHLSLIPETRKHSFCYGRADLFMRPQDLHPSLLLHELAHARGYGEQGVEHSVGFMQTTVLLWSVYIGWDYSSLYGEAVVRGLL